MTKTFIYLAALAAQGAISLFAAQISGGSVSAGPTAFNYGTGAPVPLTFSQFNPCAGCTLTGIEFDLSGTVVSTYSLTNQSGSPSTFSVVTAATIAIQDPTSTFTFAVSTPSHTTSIPALGNNVTANGSDTAVGSGTGIFNGVGPGTFTLTSFTPPTVTLSSSINSAAFIGAGTITLDAVGSIQSFISGSSHTDSISGTGSETLSVLYDYTVPSTTPEPATFMLFGSALLGGGLFARKFNKL